MTTEKNAIKRVTVRQTRLNAWLLTWEGTAGSAIDLDKKIVAVVDARRSESFIESLVDILYSRSVNSAYEMAFMANKRNQREAQYRHIKTYPSHIHYGRNPWIYARRVSNLRVQFDEKTRMEHLSWTELAVSGNAKSGSGVIEIVTPRNHEHIRPYGTLSLDIYDRNT